MNAISHMVAGICFVLIAIAVLFLGLLENSLIAGCSGCVFMTLVAIAFFRKGETLGVEEAIGRRLYRGKFN